LWSLRPGDTPLDACFPGLAGLVSRNEPRETAFILVAIDTNTRVEHAIARRYLRRGVPGIRDDPDGHAKRNR